MVDFLSHDLEQKFIALSNNNVGYLEGTLRKFIIGLDSEDTFFFELL